MLDSQIRLQNYFKNAKITKFLSELAFYTSEGHLQSFIFLRRLVYV